MIPPEFVKRFLICMAHVFPKKKLVPQKDMAEMAFRESKKRKQVCFLFFSKQIILHIKKLRMFMYSRGYGCRYFEIVQQWGFISLLPF